MGLDFDSALAQSGRYSQFSGGRSRVSGRRVGVQSLRGEYDPATLLQVAALATAPPPAPKPGPAESQEGGCLMALEKPVQRS